MKTGVIIGGMAINLLLLIGIVYVHYYAPRPGAGAIAKDLNKKRTRTANIAIIVPSQTRTTVREVMTGVTDALERDALFEPHIKVYDANGNRSLMRSNIEAAIKSEADLMVVLGSQAAQMTKELTAKRKKPIPTVFAMVGDPIKLELVDDLNCSGNNLTGVGVVGLDWIDRMVDIIPIIAPHVKKVFIPYDPTGLGGALEAYKQRFVAALEKNNYKVSETKIYETNDIGTKVPAFMDDMDLMIVLPDATVVQGIKQLAKLSEQHGKAIYAALSLGLLQDGATFAYGYHMYDVGVAAAKIVRNIIEHNRQPTTIPVDQMVDGYRIGLNIDNARSQGVLDKMNASVVFLMENGEVV